MLLAPPRSAGGGSLRGSEKGSPAALASWRPVVFRWDISSDPDPDLETEREPATLTPPSGLAGRPFPPVARKGGEDEDEEEDAGDGGTAASGSVGAGLLVGLVLPFDVDGGGGGGGGAMDEE